MLASMTSAELTEYMALERIDGPFGDARADLRAGIVAATVANHSMSPPRQPKRPIDYMPFVKRRQDGAPIALKEPRQHQALIERVLFGDLLRKPKT